MILVYFNGYGEWIVRNGDQEKLAIPRKTRKPYCDWKEHFESFSETKPDVDDYYYNDNDNKYLDKESYNKDYISWKNFEDNKNKAHWTFDYEYDEDLKGVFRRRNGVKGDIYDTNGLEYRSILEIDCGRIEGLFKLTDIDEKRYILSNEDCDYVEKSIHKLEPCAHPDSAFNKYVEAGKLPENYIDKCYFLIQNIRISETNDGGIVKHEHYNNIKIHKNNNIETAPTNNRTPNQDPPPNQNKSEKLTILNQASLLFWSNADKNDKDTWPDTKEIISWLQKKGFKETSAERAASIIRPEWAGSGRRPLK